MPIDVFDRLPLAQTCRLVDFDWVSIEAATPEHGAILVVSGIKHWLNLMVELLPRSYQARPDFWGIEVVGRLSGFGVARLVEYNVAISLESSRGLLGIEVFGATKAERRTWGPL